MGKDEFHKQFHFKQPPARQRMAAALSGKAVGGRVGGAASWLPSGARSYIDFTTQHYYAGGAVVDDVTTLFVAIPSGFGSTFSVDDITNGGLLSSSKPNFDGALLADVLQGCRIVFETSDFEEGPNACGIDSAESSNYNVELSVVGGDGINPAQSYFYDNNSQINLVGNLATPDQDNTFEITFTSALLGLSVNGASTATTPVAEGVFAQLAYVLLAATSGLLRTITVYPA